MDYLLDNGGVLRFRFQQFFGELVIVFDHITSNIRQTDFRITTIWAI